MKEKISALGEQIGVISELLIDAQKEFTKYSKILSNCDCEEQDYLHEIEFSNLSRTERNNIFKKIKNVRKLRRDTKDILDLLDPCVRFMKDNTRHVQQFEQLGAKIRALKVEQNNRIYFPNRVTDLKLVTSQNLNVKVNKEGKCYQVDENGKPSMKHSKKKRS